MKASVERLGLISALISVVTALFWTQVQAVTAVATVNVNIISSMSISTRNGLVFGDISSSASSGTIILTSTGDRTSTGGATINSSVAGSPATFDVQGITNASYSISMPASAILNDASSHTMVVDNFTSTPSASGVLDNNGQQTLFVGGTLNTQSNQAFGAYSGQMSITLDYN